MPKEFDQLLEAIRRNLKGKTNPKTKKPYTDSEIYAIAVSQWKDSHNGKPPKKASFEGLDIKFDYVFDIKSYDANKRIIEGYASFEVIDRDEEKILKEAFRDGLASYMRNPIIRYMHNPTPIGKALDARIDQNGLWIRAMISKASNLANEVWGMIEEGILKAFSIGGKIIETKEEFDAQLGKTITVITKLALREVSVVDIPANQESFFTVAKRLVEESNMGNNEVEKAKWTKAFINDLPDAAFAVIAEGGKKEEGKTVPRNLRYLPHHNAEVKRSTENDTVDLPHLKNALARLDQTDLPDDLKEKARRHLVKHAKALGVGEYAEREASDMNAEKQEIVEAKAEDKVIEEVAKNSEIVSEKIEVKSEEVVKTEEPKEEVIKSEDQPEEKAEDESEEESEESKAATNKETMTVNKSEYEALQKELEELRKESELEGLILKKLDELIVKKKALVAPENVNKVEKAKEEFRKKSFGEQAREAFFNKKK